MLVKKKGRNVASYESKYPGGVGEGLVSLMQSKSQASSCGSATRQGPPRGRGGITSSRSALASWTTSRRTSSGNARAPGRA